MKTITHIHTMRTAQLSTHEQLMEWLSIDKQAMADAEFEGGYALMRYCLNVEEHQEPISLAYAAAYWNWYCRLCRVAQEDFVLYHISTGTATANIPHLYYQAMLPARIMGPAGTPKRDIFWKQYHDMVQAVEIEWKLKKRITTKHDLLNPKTQNNLKNDTNPSHPYPHKP